MIRKTLLALALVLACMPGLSQVATGIYSYGSFDIPGFDTIDRGSLNVHFAVPIVSKTGRGLPFQYSLVYDGLVWEPVTSSGTATWSPDASFGLHGYLLNDGYKGFLSYMQVGEPCAKYKPPVPLTVTRAIVYHDEFGAQHSFTYNENPCTGNTGSLMSGDGSGFSLDTSLRVHSRSGATLSVPTYVNGAVSTTQNAITDSNGNQVTNNTNGVFTDTVGGSALNISGSGNASSSRVFTYQTTTGTAAVTVSYKTYTVQTAYGCTGVGEYNQSTALVDSITLADSSFYQFKYEATPGNSSNVTGRLASITLPTGGTISYSYTGGSNGINCADGTPTGITRTTTDGTRTYVRSSITTTSSQTSITNGLKNQNVSTYSFVTAGSPTAFYETNRANYQGAVSGTPLLSRQTCYNASASPCSTTAVTLPITQIDTYESLNGGGQHGTTSKYNTYGLQTEQDIYDFGGASARGSLLRKEAWVYPTSGIVSLVSSNTITDGSGNQISQTTYAYDETSGAGHAALATTSGLPQHGGTVGSQRGNLTTATQWNNLGASVTTTSAYEDTGNPVSTTTPNGVSQYAYDSATHAFLITNTPPTPSSGVSLPSSATSDAASGLPLTSTDPNGQTATYKSYDALLRPLEIDYPDGGKTSFNYVNPNIYYAQPYQNAGSSGYIYHDIDAYGRADRISIYNGQQSNQWYQQDSCFDANGNVQFTTYPYQGTGLNGSKHCSGAGPGDTYIYDGLGRVMSVTHADNTSVQYSYNGRATQVKDENGVTRISQVDGLGRLTSVCEVSSLSQQGVAPVACSQDINPAKGFLTTYTYTTDSSKDQVTTINQGAQTRISVVDSLGRTVSATEPERGTTTYSYAYSTTAGLGLTVTRKRPQANQSSLSTLTTTTTQYDSLGRVVSVSYSDGLTPTKQYFYDGPNWAEGSSQQHLKGRLSLAETSKTGTLYSYDAMGRVLDTWQCTPSGCGNSAYDKLVSYTYDWQGNLTSQFDPAAGNITYGRSPAGELTSVTNNTYTLSGAAGTATLLSNPTNGPNGPISYNFGNGLSQANSYDSLGRLSGGWVCVGAPSVACSNQRNGYYVGWSGSRAVGSGENYGGQGITYQYDDFNRLAGMKNSAGTSTYSYTYDRYGNRWAQNALQGGYNFSQSYNASTNQLSSGGYTYDAAGNMTYDASGGHKFTYDAEGNILVVDAGQSDSWTFVFDALNHRVHLQSAEASIEPVDCLFDIAGRATSNWFGPTTPSESHIFADSLQIAFRSNDGQTYFKHQNWLGTDRVHTDLNGATGATYTSLPFGDGGSANVSETYAGWNFQHFGSLDVDFWDSTYHAQFRNYSELQARWLSPDPYDGSYDLSNPQSFNRYAYALNNPLSFRDPSGLMECSGGDDGSCNGGGDDGGGGGSGDGYIGSGADQAPPGYSPAGTNTSDGNLIYVDGAGDTWIGSAGSPDPGNGGYNGYLGELSWLNTSNSAGLFNGGPGGRGFAPVKTPWYKNPCVQTALAKGAASTALDALGTLPEGGTIAAAFSGFYGAAGVSNGNKILGRVGFAGGLLSTGGAAHDLQGPQDSALSTTITGLQAAAGGAGIAKGLIEDIPVAGQIFAAVSVGLDLLGTGVEVYNCHP